MKPYMHNAKYYETDQMGIIHHSNYIRWMEEARIDLMDKIGCGYEEMESRGIVSPVVEVGCRYIAMSRFNENIEISVKVVEYTGVKLMLKYQMKSLEGELKAEGHSAHCFMLNGKPIALKRAAPDFDEKLKAEMRTEN